TTPARKIKLIDAFRVMLERLKDSTKDPATLRWIGQTLASMGESVMQAVRPPAQGQASELLKQSIAAFDEINDPEDLSTLYLKGRSQRLVGDFKAAIDTFEQFLNKSPNTVDAQVEAAQCYEDWASTLNPRTAFKAYRAAIEGSRKNEKGKNTIWGWAQISKETVNQVKTNPKLAEKFFESRYHVALCLYLMGTTNKRDKEIKEAIKVIRNAATLFPDLGGEERKSQFDTLMKQAQKAAGEKPVGLK
ncbi:MAG: tetratricopeptide repeat protein, partial [Planctomycetota bacterium]